MRTTLETGATRRSVLVLGTGAAVAAEPSRSAPAMCEIALVKAPGRRQIVPAQHPSTAVWQCNGKVTGPEPRVRQREQLRVTMQNRLDEETTVHLHCWRVLNAMDGVPQRSIGPGESFDYEFAPPDAATNYYHSHQNSNEQAGCGPYGPPIVEEASPIQVEHDLTRVPGDSRLTDAAAVSDDFGSRHDMGHNGRVGNTVTINGAIPERFAVRAGERIGLRLINAANARIFGLDFADLARLAIAVDGQLVTPHTPRDGQPTRHRAWPDTVLMAPCKPVEIAFVGKHPGNRVAQKEERI